MTPAPSVEPPVLETVPNVVARIMTRSSPVSAAAGQSPTDQLGEEIAVLAARLHAATYELLVMLRRFDDASGWSNGFRSCAHWLHWRTGIDLGAAREKVRVAHALADLPRLSGALQAGIISYAKVRAITRVASPANEGAIFLTTRQAARSDRRRGTGAVSTSDTSSTY